jgi:hypothetical protein
LHLGPHRRAGVEIDDHGLHAVVDTCPKGAGLPPSYLTYMSSCCKLQG